MSVSQLIPSPYRGAIRDAIYVQVPVIFLSGFSLDGGDLGAMCLIAALAYWCATVLLVVRRPDAPSRLDLAFVRFGYLPLAVATYHYTHYLWRVRGIE